MPIGRISSLYGSAMSKAQEHDAEQLKNLARLRDEATGITDNAGGLLERLRRLFQPVQDRVIGMADVPEDRYVGQAAADAERAYGVNRGRMMRDAQRFGIDPGSGNFLESLRQLAGQGAATRAGAMTRARGTAQDQGFARNLQAANLGNSLTAQALSAQGMGLSALRDVTSRYGQQASEWGALATANKPRPRPPRPIFRLPMRSSSSSSRKSTKPAPRSRVISSHLNAPGGSYQTIKHPDGRLSKHYI